MPGDMTRMTSVSAIAGVDWLCGWWTNLHAPMLFAPRTLRTTMKHPLSVMALNNTWERLLAVLTRSSRDVQIMIRTSPKLISRASVFVDVRVLQLSAGEVVTAHFKMQLRCPQPLPENAFIL